nr:MAG: hypothetical protein H3BulkLitter17783_000002 [Mitovirus sp.]
MAIRLSYPASRRPGCERWREATIQLQVHLGRIYVVWGLPIIGWYRLLDSPHGV